ncbi:MAG: peptidoglycan DD-metalloendopeptidase family protein [Bacteroidales bacterium]|nr:peptidoglycan DD-metalloendopeptidase family protein [Bacteroidales bacterium]
MKITKILAALALAALPVCAYAQTDSLRKLTIEEAQKLIPRPALQSVPSMAANDGNAMDTITTENPGIKVVLYSDNTWKYIKDFDMVANADIFTKYWTSKTTNPYGIPVDSLDNTTAIWLVDDIGQYHCPYIGSVYARGKFMMRSGRRHLGVDLPLKTGDPIYATFEGKVRYSGYMHGYGNFVIIRHSNGLETFYGHLSKRNVEENDWVNAGDVIGLGGSTGRSTGPHLHFETRYNGYAFDPQWLIDFQSGTLRHRLFVLKKRYFSISNSFENDFEDEEKAEAEYQKAEAERKAAKYYTIRSGDTLGRIAQRNHTTIKNLCRLNGIKETTILQIGRKIRIQ